jgi:hypothetical protein
MKIRLLFTAVLFPVLLIGCGGDDSTNPPTVPTTTITAAQPVSSPAAVDAAVWSSIAATSVAIPTTGIKFKRSAEAEPASTASSVSIKAAVYSDTLYMRVQWADNTFSVWPSAWRIDSLEQGSPLFEHQITWAQDQLVLLFSGLTNSGWDVWHWQVHSTSYAVSADTLLSGFAEGKTLRNRVLTTHAGDLNLTSANGKYGEFNRPTFIPVDSGEFTGYILSSDHVVQRDVLPNSGWTQGALVSGYLTDTSAASASAVDRGSRWSVKARALYEAGHYTVLLSRAMSTSYSDDLNFVTGDSVTMRLGISNNLDFTYSATQGDSEQGFTNAFILVLP